MSDLYSEFLVKKESTAKDAIVKYGLIVLTVLAAGAGLFINPLLLVLAIAFCDSTDGSGVRVSFCKRGI